MTRASRRTEPSVPAETTRSPESAAPEGAPERIHADVVVVGSGVAGLSVALELTQQAPDAGVLLVTRGALGRHGASPLAQGGIAAAVDESDSPALHAHDTVSAGGGLGRSEIVEILTEDGPGQIHRLIRVGARFDRDPSGELALGLEGAHSRRRILHADGDRTGAEVTRALREAVHLTGTIRILEHVEALELVRKGDRVDGLLARGAGGEPIEIRAPHTVLATGGPGRVYLKTTAPPGLNGDGLAMAARAGAVLRDLEFVQFHPTALNVAADPLPLVTEALRGAGAHLVDGTGRRILGAGEVDELASRDLVARAIWLRLREGDEVFLDARTALGPTLPDRFPGVYRLCREHGVDPVQELIPVTPAAHYHMGGIAVDAEGRSSLPGLWAVGEAASSGVHGANRLASNSLLEGLVFGSRSARSIMGVLRADVDPEQMASPSQAGLDAATTAFLPLSEAQPPAEDPTRPVWSDAEDGLGKEDVERVRTLLWENVGVVRTEAGMSRALEELNRIHERCARSVRPEVRNLLLSARLITTAALARRESRGSHYRSDFPEPDPEGGSWHSRTRMGAGDPAEIETEPGAATAARGPETVSGQRAQSAPGLRARETPDAMKAH